MCSSKRKRERIPSLNLENVLYSTNDDDGAVNLSTLLKLHTTLASTDLRDVMNGNVIPEDLVLLWTVSRIGFLNTVLLMNCISQVPQAMLTHRRKCILEEFNRLTNNSLDNAETYIDFMLSYCPNAISQNNDLNPTMKRYALRMFLIDFTYISCRFMVPPTTSCINCAKKLSLHHDPVKVKCFTLTGLEKATKLSLRCRNCKLNYNYSQYGNIEHGYHYYSEQREFVEASDIVYIGRGLCSLFTSFA